MCEGKYPDMNVLFICYWEEGKLQVVERISYNIGAWFDFSPKLRIITEGKTTTKQEMTIEEII